MVNTSSEPKLPRIGLMSDDALQMAGLQAILSDGNAFEVVQLSDPPTPSIELELVVIDSSATDHLVELLAVFRRSQPLVKVIVLGADNDFNFIERLIRAGARGYLSRSSSEAELRMAVTKVQEGSVWAPRKVMAHIVTDSLANCKQAQSVEIHITARERDVLGLLVLGQQNREIASTLGVDEGTVKAHMGRLMRKAGVDNRTALSMRALEWQWTSVSP